MTTKVEKTITVNVPISTAYNQWTQFEEFPQFMGGVEQITQLDDKRLHWVAQIGGVKREWDAKIVDQRPDQKIAWAATEGATNAGAVYFTAAGPNQTSLRLELEYEPDGLVEQVGDKLNIVSRQAQSDLDKFKEFIESRQVESGGWRGETATSTNRTPGVESATTSSDESGGVSAKVAVAGVAAAAVGVAAAAAIRGGGHDTEESTPDTTVTPAAAPSTAPAHDTIVDMPPSQPAALDDDVPLETPPVVADDLAADSYTATEGTVNALSDEDVQLDSSTPGISNENDGRA